MSTPKRTPKTPQPAKGQESQAPEKAMASSSATSMEVGGQAAEVAEVGLGGIRNRYEAEILAAGFEFVHSVGGSIFDYDRIPVGFGDERREIISVVDDKVYGTVVHTGEDGGSYYILGNLHGTVTEIVRTMEEDRSQYRARTPLPLTGDNAIALCEYHDVSLVQAEEPEIAGRWDWILSGAQASDASMASQAEAALDAVKTLGLRFPVFSKSEWEIEAGRGDTQIGYEEWVMHQEEAYGFSRETDVETQIAALARDGQKIHIKTDLRGVDGTASIDLTHDLAEMIYKQGKAIRELKQTVGVDFLHTFSNVPDLEMDESAPDELRLVVCVGGKEGENTHFWWEGTSEFGNHFETEEVVLEDLLKGGDLDLRADQDDQGEPEASEEPEALEVEILQHTVAFRYFGKTIDEVPESEIEHVEGMIKNGFHGGELNFCDESGVEHRGWWEVV